MYRLHANIECQIRLFRWIDKKLWIMQTRRYTTKLHGPKEREIGLPCLKYTWRLKWMKILWYSRFASLFFCLVMTVRKDIWIRTTSVTGMVVFRKDYSKSYLIRAMFKVRSEQLQAMLTAAIWKMPDSFRYYRHESTYLLIFLGQLP